MFFFGKNLPKWFLGPKKTSPPKTHTFTNMFCPVLAAALQNHMAFVDVNGTSFGAQTAIKVQVPSHLRHIPSVDPAGKKCNIGREDALMDAEHLSICNGGWVYIYIYICMRVVLNSFMWKTSSSQKKIDFRKTLANPMFIFSGTCWPRLVRKKHWCVISSNVFQASAPCHTSFCGSCT